MHARLPVAGEIHLGHLKKRRKYISTARMAAVIMFHIFRFREVISQNLCCKNLKISLFFGLLSAIILFLSSTSAAAEQQQYRNLLRNSIYVSYYLSIFNNFRFIIMSIQIFAQGARKHQIKLYAKIIGELWLENHGLNIDKPILLTMESFIWCE